MRLAAACRARVAKKKRNASAVYVIGGQDGTSQEWWQKKGRERNRRRLEEPGEGTRFDTRCSPREQADPNCCQDSSAGQAPRLPDNGLGSFRNRVTVEGRRLESFKDPTVLLDNRYEKPHPKSPDFRQEGSKKASWIEKWNIPKNISSKNNGGGSSDSGTGSHGEGRPEFSVHVKIRPHDVFSRTVLMSHHVKQGQGRQALGIYEEMQKSGFTFSSYTYVAALKACSSIKDLETAKRIHAELVQSGFKLDVYVGTTLVDTYGKCGNLVEARSVFEKMHHRNVVSWNSMILAYAQMEENEEALNLYAQMEQQGIAPNDRTFVNALKACSNLASFEHGNARGVLVRKRCLEQVRAIHSSVLRSGFESDIFVGTMLVDGYAKCGSLMDARHVFDKMPCRNVVSWTAMILGYSQLGEGEEALHLFAQMQNEGVVPDNHTFVGALKACSSLGASEEGNEADRNRVKHWCLKQVRAIHSQILMKCGSEDIFVGNMLVDAYAKSGSLVDARHVFEKMPRRNVVSWTAMILGYAMVEDGDAALQLYAQMPQEGVSPNERTFVGALKACGTMAYLEKGKDIHAQILKVGLKDTDSYVASGLIDMYCKCGSMDDAQQVFDRSSSRDVVAWNTLITGYARRGENKHVFELFEMMRQDGIKPNGITFLGLLTLCNHVGLVDEGQKYFQALRKEYGLTPSIEHYNCIIDLLGRAGQLGKAMEMVKTMPFPPPGEVCRSLLAACRKWKNVELGQQVFEFARTLDKSDPAAFVLMSNIYAGAQMHEAAEELQLMRVRAQAWKQRGMSWWTDTFGILHAFVVGNREHPESPCIQAKLQDLFVKMEEEGYVKQLDYVATDTTS